MFRLGETQELIVQKTVDFGVYLSREDAPEERVLLPKKQVPEGTTIGSKLEVFLYKDSQDRLIATTSRPKIVMGQFGALKVISVSSIGAFLDWGLEKDLFLPFKEQLVKVRVNDEVLVRLYIDKSSRLCATMKGIYEMLDLNPTYEVGEVVHGRVYELSKNFGAFVAVDDHFSALIPAHEDHSNLHVGQWIEARVTEVKADGKLTLTTRQKAYMQIDEDATKIIAALEKNNGVLAFDDKAPAELIMERVGLSKNAFKRAVGRLYKERKVEIKENQIILK